MKCCIFVAFNLGLQCFKKNFAKIPLLGASSIQRVKLTQESDNQIKSWCQYGRFSLLGKAEKLCCKYSNCEP